MYVGIAFVLAALFVVHRIYWHRKVQTQLDEIQKAGFPVTVEELNQWYETPPKGQNAADFYLKAFAHFSPDNEKATELPIIGRGKLPDGKKPLPEKLKKDLSKLLEQNRDALSLLHKATSIKKSRYPIDYTDGWMVKANHWPKLRRGSRLLEIKTIIESENGRQDSAVNSTIDILRLSQSLRNEPTVISQFVRGALQKTGNRCIERILGNTALTEPQLDRLITSLEEYDDSQLWTRATAGELCLINDYLSSIVVRLQKQPELYAHNLPANQSVSEWIWTYRFYEALGWRDVDRYFLLKFGRQYVESTKLPPEKQLISAKELKLKIEHLPKVAVSAGTLVILVDTSAAQIDDIASKRVVLAALAVERHRNRFGRLPHSLEDLVPEFLKTIPIDPYDGKPLKYKILNPGFVVYSVGDDGMDDGGLKKDLTVRPRYDIAFRVER